MNQRCSRGFRGIPISWMFIQWNRTSADSEISHDFFEPRTRVPWPQKALLFPGKDGESACSNFGCCSLGLSFSRGKAFKLTTSRSIRKKFIIKFVNGNWGVSREKGPMTQWLYYLSTSGIHSSGFVPKLGEYPMFGLQTLNMGNLMTNHEFGLPSIQTNRRNWAVTKLWLVNYHRGYSYI